MARSSALESSIQRGCIALLRFRGILALRINSGSIKVDKRLIRLAPAGTSDILAVLPPHGRLLAVEVKTPTGRLTLAQRAFLDAVRESGGVALVVRDVADLDRALVLLARDPHASFLDEVN